MNNVINFPMSQERKERLSRNSSKVLIDFKQEKILGVGSTGINPALAYGDVSVIDLDGGFIGFDNDFVDKVNKLRVKTKVDKECKRLNNKLNKLSFCKDGYSYCLIFDVIDISCSFFDEDWFYNCSVRFPENKDSVSMERKEFEKINNELEDMQFNASLAVKEFVLNIEDIFQNKKDSIRKFKDLSIDMSVA